MKILVTGGAGYVGSQLVPALLEGGHEVVVYDTFWFGDFLPPAVEYPTPENPNRIFRAEDDIRDIAGFKRALTLWGQVDVVIHLACLSNDPSSEIDKGLTKEINLDAFEPLVAAAKDARVRRFINCSTSSVYGISDAPEVREDHPHVPITLYNTYKSECEKRFWKYMSDDFECVTVRPSTVCGYSPRQRLDLAVNILTNLAYNRGVITVFGGSQLRPNLHIADMVACYLRLLEAPTDLVQGETFNVGAGNISIADLAVIVRDEVAAFTGRPPVEIETKPINDARSYQVNSDKIARTLGFRPQFNVRDAVRDLCHAFEHGLPDPLTASRYYNVQRMKEVHAELYKDTPPSAFRPQDGILSEQDMLRGAGR